VNLGVAKDQKLSLNPTQISGACGRLMCCLRYEHEFYVQSRKRFPKEGKIIVTAKGEEKIMLNDIFHDRVTLRAPDGESRILTLVELRRETSAWTPGVTDEYSVSDARDAAEEGVLPFDDAPTLTDRTRVPASDRTLPVLPSTRAAIFPSAPAEETAQEAGKEIAQEIAQRTPSVAPTPAVPPRAKTPPSVSVIPPGVVAAPMPAPVDADDDETDDADDGDDLSDETTADAADGAIGDATGDAPKRRRRRGRRGGRRGRGNRPPTGDDTAAQ
jgi:hypothetical protein